MNDFCPFLENDPLMEGQRCAAGVNFVTVGPNRSLCQVCPLSKLGDLPFCPNAEIYTYFRNSSKGPFIDVEYECLANDLQQEARCQGCPDRSRPLVSVPEKDDYLIPISE